jgi:hypothetical protein
VLLRCLKCSIRFERIEGNGGRMEDPSWRRSAFESLNSVWIVVVFDVPLFCVCWFVFWVEKLGLFLSCRYLDGLNEFWAYGFGVVDGFVNSPLLNILVLHNEKIFEWVFSDFGFSLSKFGTDIDQSRNNNKKSYRTIKHQHEMESALSKLKG